MLRRCFKTIHSTHPAWITCLLWVLPPPAFAQTMRAPTVEAIAIDWASTDGQCPGNMGHQGQDIRPKKCFPLSATSPKCELYRHRINAVRDGIVQRERGREALYLVVNTATEHIRFRYLHMKPAHMDRDGMITGRALSEGERIGLMGSFLDGGELNTTYHLHFDVQVPTRDGWLYVSPYMTLVAAHERQLGGFGREIKPDGTIASPTLGSGCR
jgi:hypothetical protein